MKWLILLLMGFLVFGCVGAPWTHTQNLYGNRWVIYLEAKEKGSPEEGQALMEKASSDICSGYKIVFSNDPSKAETITAGLLSPIGARKTNWIIECPNGAK